MSQKNNYEQFTLTKKPGMSDEQKQAFDVFKSWGYHRQEIMRMMLELLFSSEELTKPDECAFRINLAYTKKPQCLHLSAVLCNSTPTPMQTPAVSTAEPVISSPAPVTSPSTIKEESPKSVEDPNLFMDGISEPEPEEAPKRNIFNDLLAEYNSKNNIK